MSMLLQLSVDPVEVLLEAGLSIPSGGDGK